MENFEFLDRSDAVKILVVCDYILTLKRGWGLPLWGSVGPIQGLERGYPFILSNFIRKLGQVECGLIFFTCKLCHLPIRQEVRSCS